MGPHGPRPRPATRTPGRGQSSLALPTETVTVDIHCVTRWSKLDTQWRGVSLDTLLDDVETAADFALVHSYGGYTTNLPLEDLLDGKAWVAFEYDGDELRRGARRPCPAAGPAPLLLEVGEVGARASTCSSTTSPASGSSSATTTTATHGASSGTRGTERPARLASRGPRRATDRDRRAPAPSSSTSTSWAGHLAGQHVDVRLTAEDGYSRARSYSVAAPAERATASRSRCSASAGRRGVAVPHRRPAASATRSRCAVPSAAGSSGGPPQPGPGAARGRRLGRRAADGDDPGARRGEPGAVPARLLGARPPRTGIYADELRRRAAEDGGARRRLRLHPAGASRRCARPPGRIRADDLVAPRLAARLRADLLRVRADRLRRGSRPTCSSRAGHDPDRDPDRAIRRILTRPAEERGRTMTQTESGPYDGNLTRRARCQRCSRWR